MSLSNAIERYLLQLLERARGGAVEIQRNALSEIFGCSPSQINYVLETRFTAARGFLVESRRGSSGFVRIVRLGAPRRVVELLDACVGDHIGQEESLHLIERLKTSGWLSAREAAMLAAAVRRECLAIPLPERDRLRARLIRAMVLSLARSDRDLVPGGEKDAL